MLSPFAEGKGTQSPIVLQIKRMAGVAVSCYAQAIDGTINLGKDTVTPPIQRSKASPGSDDLRSSPYRLTDIHIILWPDRINHLGQCSWIWRAQCKEVHYLQAAKTIAPRKTKHASKRWVVNTLIRRAWIQQNPEQARKFCIPFTPQEIAIWTNHHSPRLTVMLSWHRVPPIETYGWQLQRSARQKLTLGVHQNLPIHVI